MPLKVEHDEKDHVFHADVEGEQVRLDYRQLDRDTLEYHRTFVPEELRGEGLAGELVTYALDWARHHDMKVVPTCPYVERFVEKNPQYEAVITRPD